MCGIVGYIGALSAKEVLLNGLSRLEYRGYDSAGIALMGADGALAIRKTTHKVAALREDAGAVADTHLGIGHTRWATHGAVNETNAHPHRAGRVTLVHNGIIENYQRLRGRLASKGRTPVSETDTEIAAMLIDSYYRGDPHEAIRRACKDMEGSYTLAILFDDCPDRLFAVCRNSPLTVAHTQEGSFLGSDVLAFLNYSRRYYAPGNDVLCELTAEGIAFFDQADRPVTVEEKRVDWDAGSADKQGYPHYMIKEIYEQPSVLRRTVRQYIREDHVDFACDNLEDGLFADVRHVHIIACGTAMHAGLTARPLFETLAGALVSVEVSSEFRDREARIDPKTLYILVSQSGETADTLAALRAIKQGGARFLSVINVKGSTMARESRNVVYTQAGPEIAVASTKAFTTQVAVLFLVALHLAQEKGMDVSNELTALNRVHKQVEQVLSRRPAIAEAAKILAGARDIFYLGRGMDMALAEEGSLKIKEISYIHAEAYPAGEMKHGTISLIEPGVPTVLIATQKNCYAKSLLCAQENRSRGGEVLLIVPDGWHVEKDGADVVLRIPGDGGYMSAFGAAATLQLLAYECAYLKGMPIDQPRNLAKSVTVA